MKIKSNQRKWLTLPQNGQLNFLTFLFPAAMASLCLVGPLCLPLRHFKPTPDLTVTLRMSMALNLTFDLDIDNDITDTCDISLVIYQASVIQNVSHIPAMVSDQDYWLHQPTRHHLSDSQISAKNYFSDIAQKTYFKAPTGSLYNNCSKAVQWHRCNSEKFI